MANDMLNPAVQDYAHEREQLLNKITVLSQNIKDRERAVAAGDPPYVPSDDDLDPIRKAQARVRKLDELIDVLGENLAMTEETKAKLRFTPGRNTMCPKYRSDGQVMSDFVMATFGNANDSDVREARRRWDLVVKTAEIEEGFSPVAYTRAAEHMGTTAAATVATAGGFGGMFVSPVVGPIIDVLPQGQPFLTAIGKQQAPNSMTFLRPTLADPNMDTAASGQGLQKNELVSKKFDVTTATLTMDTYGGYLNVSQQLITLNPTGWQLIIDQLRRRVARVGELAALANLAASTGANTIASGADAATVWAALVDAARKVWAATQAPPEWIVYGPLGWQRLARVVDTSGRPLFPSLGPVNSSGQSSITDTTLGISGLRGIPTHGISTDAVWMGNSLCFEAFSYAFPVLEAVEPSLFGRQVAVAEALAFNRPVANGAVKISA